jgi:AbrB family looped-hinge helix DNA binding protein
MEKVKVSPKGQIVIPKEFRDKFGIKEGEEVIVEELEEGVLVMKKIKEPVKAMRGLFKGKFKKSSVELVRELRKGWDRRLGNLTKG